MLLPRLFYFYCLLIFSFTSQANTTSLEALSTHPTWHKLIKYEPVVLTKTEYKSAISSKDFFLSENGASSPYSELIANIESFRRPATEQDINSSVYCRFPARYIWLKKTLGNNAQFMSSPKCKDFADWSFNGSTDSISIVFATGYLGNPASFYGHTLLKMNSSKQRKTVSIEDVSVNYGAIIPDNEHPLVYIVKGMTGGYDAGFSHIEYYFHTHNYGESELRDLWEYELELSRQEVNFVIAHAWEVLGKKYTYYFFRKNCSYRMAELVEIIPGVKIIPDNPLFVMPQEVMKNIAIHEKHSRKLLRDEKYVPSRQRRLYDSYKQLSDVEKDWISKLINNQKLYSSDTYQDLSISQKSKINETLINFYLFRKESDKDSAATLDAKYKEVLKARFKLPPGKYLKGPDFISPLHSGRPPSYLSAGFNTNLDDFFLLHYRPVYYDELDASKAHVQYSKLSMVDLELLINDSDIEIQKLDFVAVNSFNSTATGLPEDERNSWSVNFGLRRQNLQCTDCTRLYVEGDMGKGFALQSSTNLILSAGAGLQDQSDDLGNLYAFGKAKLISHVTDDVSVMTSVQNRYFFDGLTNSDIKFNFTARLRLNINSDLRFVFNRHNENALSLSYGYYF